MIVGLTDDTELVSAAAAALVAPRTERNSFTLHAPLELLARAELLPMVDLPARDRARRRIATLAQGFRSSGDELPPAPPLTAQTPADALDALGRAVDLADPDLADSAASWLAEHLSAPEIAGLLAGPLVREMGAAAHAPILFASWLRMPRADPRPFRGVARRLAEYPDIRVEPEWLDPGRSDGSVDELESALLAVPKDEEPGWGIFMLVAAAHRAKVMVDVPRVGDADTAEAFRVLFRVAARSMIEDDPSHAPYGWSHALTIPLGICQTLHLHDRRREALDVATILAAGFRHAHRLDVLPSTTDPPAAAPTIRESATRAAVEHDAHLVKYVVACRHAARFDPDHELLYRAAAARLCDWWDANPSADDPLA